MRMTTRTDLAMRALMFCAVNKGRIVRKREAARSCEASENHLAQVINALAQAGMVDTVRGRSGGFQLARAPGEISVGEVFRHFEGPVPLAQCFSNTTNTCPLALDCRLRDALARALEAFYGTLDALTLYDLVSCNAGLRMVLALKPEVPANCGPVRAAG